MDIEVPLRISSILSETFIDMLGKDSTVLKYEIAHW
jgi:hypothetical protein